jgi:hypothetical protein
MWRFKSSQQQEDKNLQRLEDRSQASFGHSCHQNIVPSSVDSSGSSILHSASIDSSNRGNKGSDSSSSEWQQGATKSKAKAMCGLPA